MSRNAELFVTIKPKSMAQDIVRRMLEHIGEGRLSPGQRLPSERELAAAMGVSRPTLREALKRLEYAGVVKTVQGGGNYILDPAGPSLRDPLASLVRDSDLSTVELAEFRTVIESWAASIAARRAEPDDLENLRRIMVSMEERLEKGLPFHEQDAEFHLGLAKAAHNRIYFQVARTICSLYFEISRVSHEKIFSSRIDQKTLLFEHGEILRAIESRNPEKAREKMRGHLLRAELWFKENLGQEPMEGFND